MSESISVGVRSKSKIAISAASYVAESEAVTIGTPSCVIHRITACALLTLCAVAILVTAASETEPCSVEYAWYVMLFCLQYSCVVASYWPTDMRHWFTAGFVGFVAASSVSMFESKFDTPIALIRPLSAGSCEWSAASIAP